MRLGDNKQAKLLAVFLLLSASAGGQAERTYKYHFNGDLQKHNAIINKRSIVIDYSISELDVESFVNENGPFFRISIPGHAPTTTIGNPELPVLSRLITIPEDCSYNIKISDIESTKIKPSSAKLEGVLFPSQERETKEFKQEKPAFIINKATYATRGLINSDTVNILPLGIVRSRRLANLFISPVRYNPKSNYLEVITSMKIEVIFTQSDIPSIKSSYPESAVFAESLSKGVLNYIPEDLITGYSDKPVTMVILTDTTFLKHLQPLLEWKRQKGFKLKILTRGARYAGTTYTELKASLSKLWLASSESDPPPEYLLIVGDVNKVPNYGGYSNITDMYYGEFDGNGDYIPDMFIGRLPVADTNELKTVVKKIIQYEKFEFADTNKFYSNAIISAGYDASYASIMNGQIKYALDNYLNEANKIKEQHFYYFSKLSVTGALSARKDSLIRYINNGTSFINYTGHGEAAGWQHIDIKVRDTASLSNKNMYPFIISNACQTSRYNVTSFGNRMVLSKDKGAIGFIGCSNDSFWDEDYYWAVGVGDPRAVNPKYEQTGLGALDRLFHTHDESPSDWYITMGQVNYSGNMAVSASTSSWKKYYWETYNLVGDPSMIPVIGQPDTFKISIPDTLPNGIKSLSLSIDPFSYVAVSHFDTLWDASYASPSGSVVMEMPGLSNDSCLFVITGQNKIPLIKKVYFSKINQQFLNLTSSDINDNSSNNNGQADFGETFSLATTISNLGSSVATGAYAKLESLSEWVKINVDSVFIGNINPGTEILVSDGFNLTIAETVPDMGIIPFEMTLKDQVSEKLYKIDITAHAPVLSIISCRIDDSGTGNKNLVADPGETVNFVFQIINEGSSNISGELNISSPDNRINILQSPVKSGNLQFGETTEIVVPARVSDNTDIGDIISLFTSLDCKPYILNKDFTFRVGRVRESFESLSFKIFPWINLSSAPWIISSTNPYDGNISARSGAISDDGTTSLIIRTIYSAPDSIRFYYKVSSEANYDYLSFRLNGTEIFKKSGESGWEKKVIGVPAGVNKLEWVYYKDESKPGGADAAWIDMIDFSVKGSVKFVQRDLELARIVSPSLNGKTGKKEVALKVLNFGQDTIKGFNLAYTLNNGTPVMQFFDKKLYPYSDSVSVTFIMKADLSKYGIYNLMIFSIENNDDYPKNDTLYSRIEYSATDEPLLVFPNPFTDQLKIVINSLVADTAQITLVNLSGMKLYHIEQKISKGTNTIIINNDVVGLSPALYYLNISSRWIRKSIPVIKIRQ
jgi:hypothetical protein